MRALILADADSRGALAGARALAAAGWDVSIGSPTRRTLAGASRAVRGWIPTPPPQDPWFARVVARCAGGFDVVFPAGDDWLLALSRHRAEIDAVVPAPPDAAVRRLLDKGQLARLAASAGIDVPRTVPATPDTLAAWDGPAAVKPALHWATVTGTRTRLEAVPVADAAAAAARVATIEAAGGRAVLQELVEGELVAVAAVIDGTTVHAACQQRAEGVWPLPFGVSTRAVTTAVDPVALERVVALCTAVGWRGLVEAQFLVGERWWLIDVNARLYGSLRLAVEAGANLPDAWGRLFLDNPGPPVVARPGVAYCWAEGELRRAWATRTRPRLHVAAGAWRDPRPGLRAATTLARRVVDKVRR